MALNSIYCHSCSSQRQQKSILYITPPCLVFLHFWRPYLCFVCSLVPTNTAAERPISQFLLTNSDSLFCYPPLHFAFCTLHFALPMTTSGNSLIFICTATGKLSTNYGFLLVTSKDSSFRSAPFGMTAFLWCKRGILSGFAAQNPLHKMCTMSFRP